jgi:hypothetical protein
MLCIVSDFAFLTRFFVLIIVSSCVIFPRDGHGAEDDSVPRGVPSLRIHLPPADVQGGIVKSPCGIDRSADPVIASLFFVISIPRSRSGILASLDNNHEVAQGAFSVFNDVLRMKKDSISKIDTSKRQIENYARVVLKENGFIWGSINSERDYQWKSKDAEEARKNSYGYLALALEMMELVTNHTKIAQILSGKPCGFRSFSA